MSQYELRLTTDQGRFLTTLPPISFDWAILLQDTGPLALTLAPEWAKYLEYDRRVEVWRAEGVNAPALMRSYFIRALEDATDDEGARTLSVTGLDGNYLMSGGIVEYAAGSAEASMTAAADDMMKAVVRNSFVTGLDPLPSNLFSVAGDLGLGPSLTKSFAWRNVLEVLKDIADESDGAGAAVYWHVQDTGSGYEFVTGVGQLGRDRSSTSARPLVLSLDYGSLKSAKLTLDATAEVNHAYVGGAGEEDARLIGESEGSRVAASVWSRRKGFKDETSLSVQASVDAAAAREVARQIPVQRFEASINPTAGTRLWYDWFFGDRLTAEYAGRYYTAMVRAVKVSVGEDGSESVDAKLEVSNG